MFFHFSRERNRREKRYRERNEEAQGRERAGQHRNMEPWWSELMAMETLLLQHSWPDVRVTLPYANIFLLLLHMILTSLLGT